MLSVSKRALRVGIPSRRSTSIVSTLRYKSSWSTAVETAARLVTPSSILKDPISLVSHEMSQLAANIGTLIGSGHPTLNRISAYYFESQGKKIRPLLVLLLSRAISEIPLEQRNRIKIDDLDIPEQPVYEGTKSLGAILKEQNGAISPLRILHGINPNIILDPLTKPHETLPEFDSKRGILPKQRRLAEIVEMIHTASLLHDDVIDNSDSRRNRPSGNIAFNNKMAVLAGDFLLGRASVSISRLRNPEVIELLSTSIANLVEGEFMQLKNTVFQPNEDLIEEDTKKIPQPTGAIDTKVHEYSVQAPQSIQGHEITHEQQVDAAFEYYIHKTYLKTAALLSKSSRSAAILSGANEDVIENCYQFGRNVGLCFQMVDDILDYTQTSEALGKPGNADLKLGLATAPILFAWRENPELGELISRKFKQEGDIEIAMEQVQKFNGLVKTQKMAEDYCHKALENLRNVLPESDSRSALEFLTNAILTRSK
ncbi:Hexaprenyl pyrophosphate synthetase,mitochondrial [Wickerhamomyces ciferrii]|uniref:Hexaprenyl pyrophosphate synthetase,mitochondrial n=1 Tax=Wickerhamomyces ciferrii (strain ATCC 14091 / BCRC 22168 / CBS 111 / JCM 3599 / NBRC 0793 / NRRL Y-1031 F-60-10) TaxID=1206466 RepID=K0KU18_WICCF|nr:Hexaprenyl pyrophosphate synthetase,mitochondrial [Wickerhamomyces ciferrii]CCH44904.1 Hexaprenyl pyrophosphate synthetase,mitochondrial [Wickerhamomyces ciferrii]